MTIIEAIKEVLKKENNALTSEEIYNKIIENNLYSFGAKNPKNIVNGVIRRHCLGIDFPSANPIKHFKVFSKNGRVTKYVINDNNEIKDRTIAKIAMNKHTKDALPEELIYSSYLKHKESIQQELLDKICDSHPAFFERIVVELLVKMGYGSGDPDSSILTGGPHDGGIDGIIKEDKLGLDKIYIQAKRYSPKNKVGINEVHRFVGAMRSVNKGVFITTSDFTKSAYDYEKEQEQKNIVLINGYKLTELMIKYNLGVSTVKSYQIYRVDSDYFDER